MNKFAIGQAVAWVFTGGDGKTSRHPAIVTRRKNWGKQETRYYLLFTTGGGGGYKESELEARTEDDSVDSIRVRDSYKQIFPERYNKNGSHKRRLSRHV